jgi:hypothetical protein
MRFEIVGADAQTGDDVDVFLDARDQSEVEQIAHKKGILVSAVKEAPDDGGSIALIADDPPPAGGNGATDAKHGMITVNASSPSDTAHTGEGRIQQAVHAEGAMEYHIMLNQSLYLLESAVNKYIKDGWEPQGGLTVGTSNNALQFFQALIRRKKTS